MATFTLDAPDKFPATTPVAAYKRWTDTYGTMPPVGPPVETETVQDDGTVAFTALADDTEYLAHAVVNGNHAYIGFRTDPPPVGGPAGGGSGIDTTGWGAQDVPYYDKTNDVLARGKKQSVRLDEAPYFISNANNPTPSGGIYATNLDAFRAAISDYALLAVNGPATADLIFPIGTINLDKTGTPSFSAGSLPWDVQGNITVRGAPGLKQTIIKFGGAGSLVGTFLTFATNPNTIASQPSIFRNITIRDLHISCLNTTNTGPAVCLFNGPFVNVENIRIENVTTGANGGPTGSRANISIGYTRPAGSGTGQERFSANELFARNITIRNCDFGIDRSGGGATGIYIAGFADGNGTGIPLYDGTGYWNQTRYSGAGAFTNILIENFKWDSGTDPTAFSASDGIQIGGDGYTENVTLRNVYIRGAGDTAIEIDQGRSIRCENVTCENCINAGWDVLINHGGEFVPERQGWVFENCTYIRSWANNYVGDSGWAISSFHNGRTGAVVMQGCRFEQRSADFTSGSLNSAIFVGNNVAHVHIEDFELVASQLNMTTVHTVTFPGIDYEPTDNGQLTVRRFNVQITGKNTSGGGGLTVQPIQMKSGGGRALLDVDGVYWRTNFDKGAGYFQRTSVAWPGSAVSINDEWASDGQIKKVKGLTGFVAAGTQLTNVGLGTTTYVTQDVTLTNPTGGDTIQVGSLTGWNSTGSVSIPGVGTATYSDTRSGTWWTSFHWDTGNPDNYLQLGGSGVYPNPNAADLTTLLQARYIQGPGKTFVGRSKDCDFYIEEVWPTTNTGNAHELRCRVGTYDRAGGICGLWARVFDDGTHSIVETYKRIDGTDTLLDTANLASRVVGGAALGLRLMRSNNVVTADVFTTAPGGTGPNIATAGQLTRTVTLTGGDTNVVGADSPVGHVGFGWKPAHATAKLTIIRTDQMTVLAAGSKLLNLDDVEHMLPIAGGSGSTGSASIRAGVALPTVRQEAKIPISFHSGPGRNGATADMIFADTVQPLDFVVQPGSVWATPPTGTGTITFTAGSYTNNTNVVMYVGVSAATSVTVGGVNYGLSYQGPLNPGETISVVGAVGTNVYRLFL